MTLRLIFFALAVSALAAAQEQQLPRFRSGANLVSVDAYVSKDGVPVTDLRPEDLEVLEDDRPQKIESFRLVRAREAGGATTRPEPLGSAAQRDAMSDPDARLFVLFLDQWHVSLGGSARAQAPVSEILNKVISPEDLVGVMTPEMSPQSLNLTRRTAAIDRMMRDNWTWGERDKGITTDPRERDLVLCYPDDARKNELSGVAKELIERRRELKTLQSLDALVSHLGTLRDERKFVVVLTEGWVLFRRNDRLGGVLAPVGPGSIPGAPPVGVGTDGKLVVGGDSRDPARGGLESCDRERVLLSFVDHEYELRQLAQKANRANVSFYIIDPRGLVAFDDTIGPMRPATLEQDRARLGARHDGVRELAHQTDGAVVLNTNDVRGATARIMADLGSYYLMNYYSTNPKLDGRFRRITVRVKRDGVEVRARPGYLAPTEAEARAAGVAPAGAPGGPAALPAIVTRALEMITPARGNLPVRIQAAGGRGSIRAVVELDSVTLKLPEWASGGSVRLTIDPEKGSGPESQIVMSAVDPGVRSVVIASSNPFPPGRYIIRAEVTPKTGRMPVQASTAAIVPPEAAEVGTGLLALRRGPSTGLAYVPTADPRFRRTERLRVEVPLAAADFAGAARLLTRTGQPMPLVATYTTRVDAPTNVTFGVAEVVLAPLAAGDYVLELTLTRGGTSEVVAYGFRIVP